MKGSWQVLAISLLAILFGALVWATKYSGTYTVSQGVYSGAPDYIIWVDNGKYYAKDLNGAVVYRDSTASNAINYALTAGGTVYIENGNYPIPAVLSITSKSNASLILASGARLYRSVASTYCIVRINLCTRVTVTGGVIDGVYDDKTEPMNGALGYLSNTIRIENSTDVLVQNVALDNASDDAVYITNSTNIRIIGNTVTRFYKHAIDVSDESSLQVSGNIVIMGNHVDGQWHAAYDGITVDAYYPKGISIMGNTVKNVYNTTFDGLGYWESGIHVEDRSADGNNETITIMGNTISGCQRGITSASTFGTTITGNSIHNSSTMGIQLVNSDHAKIESNSIQLPGCRGIEVDGGHNTIVGNTIRNSTQYGIYAYGDEVTYHDPELIISANLIEASYLHGIYAHDFGYLTISNNHIIDSSLNTTNTYSDVYLLAEPARQSVNNTIHGNTFRSTGPALSKYQVYLGSYVNQTLVTDNVFGTGGATAKVYYAETGNTFAENMGY